MDGTGAVGVAAVLLVALAGGIGWGIRGCYGGAPGATLPGALIALAICLVSGRADWQQASLYIAAVAACGLAYGGFMSHVKLAHFSRSASHLNAAYGLGALFFVTGLWGGIGGGALGLALGGWSPWAIIILAAGMILTAHIAYWVLIDLIGIRLTPPRSEAWARTFGAFLCMAIVCVVRREHVGLVGLTYGYMGWGFGFLVGMFIQLIEIRAFGHRSFNWWRAMEVTIGCVGGASLAIGILPLARTLPDLPPLPAPWLALGAYFTLWFIVLLHIRTNFRHYKLSGLLLEGRWANRTALWLADVTSVALAVAIGIILAAWHFRGPADPRVGVQASLLGLAGMCVLLVSVLDVGSTTAKNKRVRLATAWWFVPPYLVLIAGTLAAPQAFTPPLVHGVGVADFWRYGVPLAAVLAILFSKITSSLWDTDPPQAHRRFGPGADNDVYGTVPPPKPYEEPKPRTAA
ncbi:MAG: hypothetical protein JSV65_04910 [Armatimonadota bacterium]|nr:MAG: hypothetical protein JSV65_04910 [Armatimonadota bacterium]